MLATKALGATAIGFGLGAATLGYSLWEARRYTLRQVEVGLPVRGFPRPRPLRILHLSDLHVSPRDEDRIAWIRDLARLDPDLTVVTGDFLGAEQAAPLVLRAVAPLLDAPGAFVRGSNDYYAPRRVNPLRYFTGPSRLPSHPRIAGNDLTDGLLAAGWHDLDNRATQLAAAGWRVAARGVDDPHIRLDRYQEVAGPYPPGADLRLAVTHAPYRRVLDQMTSDDPDLILAGHTHGGQICVPGFGALVTNCDISRDRVKGLSDWDGVPLHVSAGLGTNPYTPIRLACRPEATLLTVH